MKAAGSQGHCNCEVNLGANKKKEATAKTLSGASPGRKPRRRYRLPHAPSPPASCMSSTEKPFGRARIQPLVRLLAAQARAQNTTQPASITKKKCFSFCRLYCLHAAWPQRRQSSIEILRRRHGDAKEKRAKKKAFWL